MQVRAIIEAALNVRKKGVKVKPKIMIPQVGHVNELKIVVEFTHKIVKEVFAERKEKLDYEVGTMIEVPRACVTADQLAEVAQFFSFGTNDLTQAGSAFSRDDAGKFLKAYLDIGVYAQDPFVVLDREGIGELVRIAIEKGRKTNPKLEIGICGEHGGDPDTIKFCHKIGMTYVSCSPFRVPIARLAAAHAAIEEKRAKGKPAIKGKGKWKK
jgi:pyruvate,orthophosphate dikinase